MKQNETTKQESELLKTQEVIEMLNISYATLHRLTRTKVLKHYIIGGSIIRFKKSDVLDIIRLVE